MVMRIPVQPQTFLFPPSDVLKTDCPMLAIYDPRVDAAVSAAMVVTVLPWLTRPRFMETA